jgi:rubrerythrin
MEHTYDELKKKTVAQLREIASGMEHEAVQGYTQLNKEHLLAALCKALNIDTHKHHKTKAPGIDKAKIKSQMKALKKERDAALESHDHAQLKTVRRKLHELRRTLRTAASSAAKSAPKKKK